MKSVAVCIWGVVHVLTLPALAGYPLFSSQRTWMYAFVKVGSARSGHLSVALRAESGKRKAESGTQARLFVWGWAAIPPSGLVAAIKTGRRGLV